MALPPGSSVQGYIHPGVQAVYADVRVPAPAAGVDWSWTVPGSRWARLWLGRAIFTTSAQAGERGRALYAVRDGDGLTRGLFTHNNFLVASTVYQIFYMADLALAQEGVNNRRQVYLPRLWVPGGWSIGSETHDPGLAGIQSEDQWSGVRLWIELPYDTGEPPAASLPDWVGVGLLNAA